MNAHRAAAALVAAFAVVLALIAAPAARAALTFPPLTGRVVDDAHVLSQQTVADLDGKLEALEAKTGRQLVVVTLPSLQGDEIEDYGYQLGRAWGIGQKGKDNGVLLIVAPTERKVRIEVGYGLEPVITDALSSVILQSAVLPKFRTGDVEGGVVAGTDALIGQLSADPDAAKAKTDAAAVQTTRPHGLPVGALITLVFLFVIFSGLFRGHYGGGMGWFLPMMILSSAGRRDGWGGGWGGGGGLGGGGGFSGGGGSFGGGGASGGW